jgi:hypothetical protein
LPSKEECVKTAFWLYKITTSNNYNDKNNNNNRKSKIPIEIAAECSVVGYKSSSNRTIEKYTLFYFFYITAISLCDSNWQCNMVFLGVYGVREGVHLLGLRISG